MGRLGLTTRRKWLIAGAITLCIWYIFGPAVNWLTSVAIRPNRISAGHLQAAVPRFWRVLAIEGSIFVSKRGCMTVFCSSESMMQDNAVVSVMWIPSLHTGLGFIRESMVKGLEDGGYGVRWVSSVGESGSIECAEGRLRGKPRILRCSCLAPDSDLRADFEGDTRELSTFYQIMKSARIR